VCSGTSIAEETSGGLSEALTGHALHRRAREYIAVF